MLDILFFSLSGGMKTWCEMHLTPCSIMTDEDTKIVCGGNGTVDDILHICVIFFVVLYVFFVTFS